MKGWEVEVEVEARGGDGCSAAPLTSTPPATAITTLATLIGLLRPPAVPNTAQSPMLAAPATYGVAIARLCPGPNSQCNSQPLAPVKEDWLSALLLLRKVDGGKEGPGKGEGHGADQRGSGDLQQLLAWLRARGSWPPASRHPNATTPQPLGCQRSVPRVVIQIGVPRQGLPGRGKGPHLEGGAAVEHEGRSRPSFERRRRRALSRSARHRCILGASYYVREHAYADSGLAEARSTWPRGGCTRGWLRALLPEPFLRR